MSDDEIEQVVRHAIDYYCPPEERAAVHGWLDNRLNIVAAVAKLGIEPDDVDG